MWDKELMEEFRSLLANGAWNGCEDMLDRADPSPDQATVLLQTAQLCKGKIPRHASIVINDAARVIIKLKSICEPRRFMARKVKKKPSRKEILGEQADLVVREVAQKEGRRKGRGTVVKGWEQKPGDV